MIPSTLHTGNYDVGFIAVQWFMFLDSRQVEGLVYGATYYPARCFIYCSFLLSAHFDMVDSSVLPEVGY